MDSNRWVSVCLVFLNIFVLKQSLMYDRQLEENQVKRYDIGNATGLLIEFIHQNYREKRLKFEKSKIG